MNAVMAADGELSVVPVTSQRWPDIEVVFGTKGDPAWCFCQFFLTTGRGYEESAEQNRRDLCAQLSHEPPPGLLAFDGERAIGWMQIGPRADVPEWNSPRRVSAPLDEGASANPDVWAISCFFVRSSARGKGLSHRLVTAGVDFARAGGARQLEACPIDQSKDSRSVGLFVGSTRVFEKAGFARVAERRAGRPLMRLVLG